MIGIENQFYVVVQSFFLGCMLNLIYEIYSSVGYLFGIRNTIIKRRFVEENTCKQEELCQRMCECIYLFLKCNSICGNLYDITEFEEILKNTIYCVFRY